MSFSIRVQMRQAIQAAMVSALALGAASWAESPQGKDTASAPGPHGGEVLKDKQHEFEVTMDPNGGGVSVYQLRAPSKSPPRKMSLTLLRNPSTSETVDLQLMDRSRLGQGRELLYQGKLSPEAQSYMGLELKIETSLKQFKILKSMPRLPTRGGH